MSIKLRTRQVQSHRSMKVSAQFQPINQYSTKGGCTCIHVTVLHYHTTAFTFTKTWFTEWQRVFLSWKSAQFQVVFSPRTSSGLFSAHVNRPCVRRVIPVKRPFTVKNSTQKPLLAQLSIELSLFTICCIYAEISRISKYNVIVLMSLPTTMMTILKMMARRLRPRSDFG